MLDHVVLVTPDLAASVAAFERSTGVRPAPGGSHVGRGTANFLVGFAGESSYLEIVGPDPAQPAPDRPRPCGVDDLDAARVSTWAVRPDDLDDTIARARARGYDPGDASAMSRRTTDGELLEWRLTPADVSFDGLVPFLIDWGTTPHPTVRGLPAVRLVSLRMTHPDPAGVTRAHAALELLDVELGQGDTATIELTLDTPSGPVVLGGP